MVHIIYYWINLYVQVNIFNIYAYNFRVRLEAREKVHKEMSEYLLLQSQIEQIEVFCGEPFDLMSFSWGDWIV